MRTVSYPLQMTEPQYFGLRLVSLLWGISGIIAIFLIHTFTGKTEHGIHLVTASASERSSGALNNEHQLLLSLVGINTRSVVVAIPITKTEMATGSVAPLSLPEPRKEDVLGLQIDGLVAVGDRKYIVIEGDTFGVGDVLDNQARVISIDDEHLEIELQDASRQSIPVLK